MYLSTFSVISLSSRRSALFAGMLFESYVRAGFNEPIANQNSRNIQNWNLIGPSFFFFFDQSSGGFLLFLPIMFQFLFYGISKRSLCTFSFTCNPIYRHKYLVFSVSWYATPYLSTQNIIISGYAGAKN